MNGLTRASQSKIDGGWPDASCGGDLLSMFCIKLKVHENTQYLKKSIMSLVVELKMKGTYLRRVS